MINPVEQEKFSFVVNSSDQTERAQARIICIWMLELLITSERWII